MIKILWVHTQVSTSLLTWTLASKDYTTVIDRETDDFYDLRFIEYTLTRKGKSPYYLSTHQ